MASVTETTVGRGRPNHAAATGQHRGWTAQARTTILESERYTRFVSIMKRALLLAAGALLLAVVAYSLQPRDSNRYAMTFAKLGKLANDLAMVKPHLSGTDGDGNPFIVTADMAVQDPHHLHRANLSSIQADLTGKDKAWYTLGAPHGLLDTDAQKLWLDGGVSLYADSGYELHTRSAFVDLAQSCDPKTGKPPPSRPGKPVARCTRTAIRGEQTVTGHGPLGNVRADRFHVAKPSNRLFLYGHVAMRIYPAQASHKSKTSKVADK